jgi:hypothetical protein
MSIRQGSGGEAGCSQSERAFLLDTWRMISKMARTPSELRFGLQNLSLSQRLSRRRKAISTWLMQWIEGAEAARASECSLSCAGPNTSTRSCQEAGSVSRARARRASGSISTGFTHRCMVAQTFAITPHTRRAAFTTSGSRSSVHLSTRR